MVKFVISKQKTIRDIQNLTIFKYQKIKKILIKFPPVYFEKYQINTNIYK